MSSGRHEGIPRSTAYNLGAAPVAAKGTTQDYLTYLSAIPAQIMALKWVFSGVVKAPERPGKRHPCRIAVSIHPTATRRRRLDTDPAVDQADQRTGKGSLQP